MIKSEAPDVIDAMAGIGAATALYTLRRARPEYVTGTDDCRASIMSPPDDRGVPPALRIELALRMARLLGYIPQVEHYREQAEAGDPLYRALADGELPDAAPDWLRAIARHCDNVTKDPAHSRRQDIERLQSAGLDAAQIVALAQLIAFVNYEARVAAGLAALGALL